MGILRARARNSQAAASASGPTHDGIDPLIRHQFAGCQKVVFGRLPIERIHIYRRVNHFALAPVRLPDTALYVVTVCDKPVNPRR